MAIIVKPNPEELVRAFREATTKLGWDKSEQRFQEALMSSVHRRSATRTCQEGHF